MKRRWLLLLLILPFLLVSQPAFAAEGPVRLSVQPNADGTLTSTVTNSGDRGCRLAAIGDGTLTVLSVTRDGKQPDPEYRNMSYFPSYERKLKEASQTVAPGQSISFTSPIRSVAVSTGGGTASQWSLADGRYEIRAVYRMPTAAGTDACLGPSNVATATLIAGDDSDGVALWLVVAVVAGGVLLLLVIVLLLVRRRRRSTAAALTAVALLAGALGAAHPQRADAFLDGVPAEAASCISLIRAHDVGNLMPAIDDPNYRIRIQTGHNVNETSSGRTDATITWDPDYTQKFDEDPTVAAWPCASLYHELTHAFDAAQHKTDSSPCMHGQQGKSVVMTPSVKEIHATRVENAFRDAFSLPNRTGYVEHGDLPPGKGLSLEDAQADCKPSPPADKGKGGGKGGRDKSRLNPAGPRGHSNGDPHLATIDGRYYDFQAAGEFVLAKGPGLEVQVRQQPLDGSRVVSVNSAVAIQVGADKINFQIADDKVTVRVNGREQAVTGEAPLPGGGSIATEEDTYFVDSADGSEIQLVPIGAWGLLVQVYPAPALHGKLTGLLGNFDGDPANDLALPDGSQLPEQPSREQVYGAFADTWRVHNSLLDYAPGQTTATFTDKSFPDKVMTPAELPSAAREAAGQVCSSYGVSGADLDACILDVALTGQTSFAVGTARTAEKKSDGGTTTPPTPTPTRSTEPSVTPRPGTNQTLTDGGVVNATFDKPGQVNTYRLSLGAATVFWLADVTGDGNLNVQLVGPSAVDAPGFTVTTIYQYRVQPGGSYSLRVSRSDDSTGSYGFKLFTAKERRLSTALNQQVTGNLDVPGRVDLYTFTLAQDQKVTLADSTGCDFAAAIVEDDPQPHSFSPTTVCDGIFSGTLTAGTKYLIALWSPEGKTGPYSFHLKQDE